MPSTLTPLKDIPLDLTSLDLTSLDFTSLDFTDADEVINAATRLCGTANAAGIFLHESDPERDRTTIKLAKRAAKDWLRSVRRHIDEMSEAAALRLLPSYDTLHRVAYGLPGDSAFLNKYIMAAFESRIRGNKEVDPYLLYRQINAGIGRRDPLYFGRPLQWATSILDRWYKQLSGHTPDSDPLYDRLQKAAILMETDLWIYEGSHQKAFKQQLFNQLTSLCLRLVDISDQNQCELSNTNSFNTIKSLDTFLLSSRCCVSKDAFIACCETLREILDLKKSGYAEVKKEVLNYLRINQFDN